jgi:hypothetical protein
MEGVRRARARRIRRLADHGVVMSGDIWTRDLVDDWLAMRWPSLSPVHGKVLAPLAWHMKNAKGDAFPSLETLAAESGYSKTRTRKILDEIEAAFIIRVIRGKPGRGHSTHYLPGDSIETVQAFRKSRAAMSNEKAAKRRADQTKIAGKQAAQALNGQSNGAAHHPIVMQDNARNEVETQDRITREHRRAIEEQRRWGGQYLFGNVPGVTLKSSIR